MPTWAQHIRSCTLIAGKSLPRQVVADSIPTAGLHPGSLCVHQSMLSLLDAGASGAALHSGNAIALPIGSITPLALSVAGAISAAARSLPSVRASGTSLVLNHDGSTQPVYLMKPIADFALG